ncbi:MAG: hypothetical protein ACTS73_05310 [Arsenophonus sp. NEOnobi-MAG3]
MQEEMIRHYISHILARHFNMIRYYAFFLNCKRRTLLPKVYKALEMKVCKKSKNLPHGKVGKQVMKLFLKRMDKMEKRGLVNKT